MHFGRLHRARVASALHLTFARREAHALPATLIAPPEDWQTPFEVLAEECGLDLDVAMVFDGVRVFENVIKGNIEQ